MSTEDEIRALKRRHSAELLRRPEVSGVGVERDEDGEFVLAVHLNTADPKVIERLPRRIEGYRIRYLHSGPFRKQFDDWDG